MQISEEQLNKFASLYLQRFGVQLSREEVLEKATSLLMMMKAVYQPITKEDLKQAHEKRSCLIK